MSKWIWQNLIAIDQLANTLLGPLFNLFGLRLRWCRRRGAPWLYIHKLSGWHRFGYADETISSVLGKNKPNCVACYWVCRGLHLLDPDHCHKSIESDEGSRRS